MAVVFHEVRFPTDISYGSTFGPEYSTDVVTMKNGSEQRNINWSQTRCSGNAVHSIRTADQFARLLAFFRNRKGKAYGFRFKDHSDYRGVFEAIGWGDGAATSFQLVKNYIDVDLNIADTRTIYKPVSGTVYIYFKQFPPGTIGAWSMQTDIQQAWAHSIPVDAPQVGNWSVDTVTGKVTFLSPPPANMLVMSSFEFDVPCRFDTDKMPTSMEALEKYGWHDIPIIELKLG